VKKLEVVSAFCLTFPYRKELRQIQKISSFLNPSIGKRDNQHFGNSQCFHPIEIMLLPL